LEVEILHNSPKEVGGKDFTAALFNHVVQKHVTDAVIKEKVRTDGKWRDVLMCAVEKAKEGFTTNPMVLLKATKILPEKDFEKENNVSEYNQRSTKSSTRRSSTQSTKSSRHWRSTSNGRRRSSPSSNFTVDGAGVCSSGR
jgi:hypothetical protein